MQTYRDIIAYIIMYSIATHLYWNSMHRSEPSDTYYLVIQNNRWVFH